MEIKPHNAHVSITTLATYQRSVQILQRTTIHSPPANYDDIIDHVEIETRRPPPTTMDTIKYTFSHQNPSKEKGTFVDIWI
jgi:hypothetical protein